MKIEDSEFKNIKDFCEDQGKAYERWPSYYERRYLEFLSYYSLFPSHRLDTVLELGCGIGYQSAFLSKVANKVVATDLEDESIASHAPGMLRAMKLHQNLKVSNVILKACSAENLPFEDNSFDMVYSSHVLEHIPNLEKALQEIYRVLKPGGINFCVVPTRADKFYSFFNFYSYLASRFIIRIGTFVKNIFSKSNYFVSNHEQKKSKDSASKTWLMYFPFPPPHGHYSHFLEEFKLWSPSQWKKRTLAAAPFVCILQCTTQFNPLLSLMGAFAPKWGTKIHALTRKFELKLGKTNLAKSIGLNTVLILKKIQNDYGDEINSAIPKPVDP